MKQEEDTVSNRPTIQTVADLAGVSRGTVDRVLNDRPYVSDQVRRRVLDAVQATGYVSHREHYKQLLNRAVSLTVGVLLPNWENQFRAEVEQGIHMAQEELEDAAVRVVVRRCHTDIPQEALNLLDELLAEGAAGLAICALRDEAIEKRVAQLVHSGIPCVTFNSDLPNSRRTCFVGQDVYRTGRVAAELMGKSVPSGAKILATVGNRKFDGHQKRLQGFLDRMEELGFDQKQTLVRETFNDYAATVEVVSQVLETHPDLAGIYMANLSVSGCAEAVRACGQTGRVRIICHDINAGIRQLLLDGRVDYTIPQDFVQQGYAPILLLKDLLRKGKITDPSRFAGQIGILCRENL